MTRLAILTALPFLLLGCGTQDVCRTPEVLLTSASAGTATYDLSFKDVSCDILVPGTDGFDVATPESIYCETDNQGEFRVDYLDPDRADCTPDNVGGDGVMMGNCWDGAPMTRLIWLGALRPDETLVVTLSGPTDRTVEIERASCNGEPIAVDL